MVIASELLSIETVKAALPCQASEADTTYLPGKVESVDLVCIALESTILIIKV